MSIGKGEVDRDFEEAINVAKKLVLEYADNENFLNAYASRVGSDKPRVVGVLKHNNAHGMRTSDGDVKIIYEVERK